MTATGTFIFICSACGYKARLPEQYAGRTIKCPGCQAAQVAVAPAGTQRKTATIIRVAATPEPFSLPTEQADALATATPPAPPAEPRVTPKAFPSPLPGAIQVTTDRTVRSKTPPPDSGAPVAKPLQGGTVDFTCTSCHARLRLPAQYAGKSILCPKCSTPQKVTPAIEPMATTRALAQKPEGVRPATSAPAAAAVPPAEPGTGVRARAAAPPARQPTPLPTYAPPPVQAVEATPVLPVAPLADDLEDLEEAAELDDELEVHQPEQAFDKPHPSKSSSRPRTSAIRAMSPPPPARTSRGLLIAAGILGLAALALGAGYVYQLRDLHSTKTQLQQAEEQARIADQREQETQARLKELTDRLIGLELQLKIAEEARNGGMSPEEGQLPIEPPPSDGPSMEIPPEEAPPSDEIPPSDITPDMLPPDHPPLMDESMPEMPPGDQTEL